VHLKNLNAPVLNVLSIYHAQLLQIYFYVIGIITLETAPCRCIRITTTCRRFYCWMVREKIYVVAMFGQAVKNKNKRVFLAEFV